MVIAVLLFVLGVLVDMEGNDGNQNHNHIVRRPLANQNNILRNNNGNVNGMHISNAANSASNVSVDHGDGVGQPEEKKYDISTLPDYVQEGIKLDTNAASYETLYWATKYSFDDRVGCPRGSIWDNFKRWNFYYKISTSGVSGAAKPRTAKRAFCEYCKMCVGATTPTMSRHMRICKKAPAEIAKVYQDKYAAERNQRKRKRGPSTLAESTPSIYGTQSTTTTNVPLAPWLPQQQSTPSHISSTSPYYTPNQPQKKRLNLYQMNMELIIL